MKSKFDLVKFLVENRKQPASKKLIKEEFIELGDFIPKIEELAQEFNRWYMSTLEQDAEEYGFDNVEDIAFAAKDEILKYLDNMLTNIAESSYGENGGDMHPGTMGDEFNAPR